MRITIVIPDKTIIVDGEFIEGLDITSHIPYAKVIQWYDDHGDIELDTPSEYKTIKASYKKDVEPFYNIWLNKKKEIEAEEEKARKEQEEYEKSYEYLYKLYETAVDNWMDSIVQTRGYFSAATCAGWAGDDDPVFNAEGTAVKKWRSRVYRECYNLLNIYKDYNIEDIPSVEEFIDMLPRLVW